MEVLLLLVTGAINVLCFMIGAKVGQKVTKDQPIEFPKIDPLEIVKNHREAKEAEIRQSRFDTILSNIEKYDGTARGQEDVSGGKS